jgi:peroxiredoxin Q/BCP
MSLSPGSPIPSFKAFAVGGEFQQATEISEADLSDQTTVLYFYPKDDTPGCTTQACGIRDGWSEISKHAKLFGVSVDPIRSHEKFIRKHQLPFPLISDESHAIAEAFGVWVEKKLYGKTYMGTERTTFVIGPDGIIKAVLPKVKPDEHLDRVLAALDGTVAG